MFKRYRLLILLICIAIALTTGIGLSLRPLPSLPMTDGSVSTISTNSAKEITTTPPPKEPPTLADAQAAYKYSNGNQFYEAAQSYMNMSYSFAEDKWYTRCLELCDVIIQRWPNDQDISLQAKCEKARMLALLKRWQEAYALVDAIDARSHIVQTQYRGDDVPFTYDAHFLALGFKISFLTEEHKYREAAAMNDQLCSEIQTPSDDAAKQFFENQKEVTDWDWHFSLASDSASLLYKAGDYSTALSRYTTISTFASTHTVPEKLGGPLAWDCAFKIHYAIPVEIAMCQMKLAHYAEALQGYRDIESSFSAPETRRQTFFTLHEDNRGVAIDKQAIENPVAATYFTKVDLQTRIAECLIQLKKKAQAQQALSIAQSQLKDSNFQEKFRPILSDYDYYSINGRFLDNGWIDEMQTVTIPALQKEIDGLQ